MQKHLLLAVAVATSSLVAQNNLSNFLNMGVTFTSRNGANFVPATIYTRLDVESYAGWGFDAGQPGLRVFSGLRFDIQDQDLATQDTFQLTAYTELTPPSNTPDTTAPIATTGNFVLPVGTGAGAYLASANFVTPIAAPATADVSWASAPRWAGPTRLPTACRSGPRRRRRRSRPASGTPQGSANRPSCPATPTRVPTSRSPTPTASP